jgi:hypothetical protein
MAIRLTPTLGLTGVYSLETPYTLKPNTLYTCRALRSFKDVEQQGVGVFETYYESFGVSYERYRSDLQSDAYLVTLSATGASRVVPDTFIEALPERTSDTTSLIVLSVDLGPLPDTLGLSHVTEAIGAQCLGLLGYQPDVRLMRLQHTDSLTNAEQDNIETARQASVEIRKDVYARLEEEKAANVRLNAKLQRMEQLLLVNGLVQPTP